MTRNNHSWFKKATIAFVAVLLGGYVLWVVKPFNDKIRVHNSAGISDQEVVEVIAYARSRGAFSEGKVRSLAAASRWTPWKRGFLFINIRGDVKHIDVAAGFVGGPLNGGGPLFNGEKTQMGGTLKPKGFG